jgi:beta-lactamase family protein
MADREARIAATCDTAYDVMSMTKQFTAAAILKLELMGKLKVTDRIRAGALRGAASEVDMPGGWKPRPDRTRPSWGCLDLLARSWALAVAATIAAWLQLFAWPSRWCAASCRASVLSVGHGCRSSAGSGRLPADDCISSIPVVSHRATGTPPSTRLAI